MVAENPTDPEHGMDISPISTQPPARQQELMAKAEELEATFLSEMLAHSGLGEMQGAFGGGQGEAQFTSFLRQEQARLMVQSGGLGLAELIFNAMTRAEDGTA
jgi:flagellar protein FlgJ